MTILKKTFTLCFWCSILFLSGCAKEPEIIAEKPIIPEVKIMSINTDGFDDYKEYTGTVKPVKEINLFSQGKGLVKKIYFNLGDKIQEKDTLVELDQSPNSEIKVNYDNWLIAIKNTQETLNLTDSLTKLAVADAKTRVEELEIALANEYLNLENTQNAARQNIESSELNYNNTQTQYQLSVNLTQIEVETAQETLDNFRETAAIELNNLLETVEIDIKSILSALQNQLETVNNIIGEDPRNNEVNDAFEIYLGVLNKQSYIDAQNSYRQTKDQLNKLVGGNFDTINTEEKLDALLAIAFEIKKSIDYTDQTLMFSITSINFPQEQLDGLKTAIDNLQNGVGNINIIINQIQNFKQQIKNLKITNNNQENILKLNLDRAQKTLENIKQTTGSEEATSLKTAKKQLELTQIQSKSQLDAAKARIESLKKQLENAKIYLEKTKTDRQNNLHSIQQRLDELAGNLDLAKISLDDQSILSPLTGTVISKNIEIGDELSPGSLIGTVADLSQVKIQINVARDEVKFFKLNQIAIIENNKEGKISKIYPVADAQSKKFIVEIEINNSENEFKPESFVQTKIKLRDFKNKIFIPLNAITVKQNKNLVYTIQDNIAQEISIEIGEIVNNMVEVINGLNSKDQLIVDGLKFVEDGVPIKIIP